MVTPPSFHHLSSVQSIFPPQPRIGIQNGRSCETESNWNWAGLILLWAEYRLFNWKCRKKEYWIVYLIVGSKSTGDALCEIRSALRTVCSSWTPLTDRCHNSSLPSSTTHTGQILCVGFWLLKIFPLSAHVFFPSLQNSDFKETFVPSCGTSPFGCYRLTKFWRSAENMTYQMG